MVLSPPLVVVFTQHAVEPEPHRALVGLHRAAAVVVHDKHLSFGARYELAARCVAAGLRTIVAVRSPAETFPQRWPWGVHGCHLPRHVDQVWLPRSARAAWLVGKSCHSVAEVQAAADCDYVTLSPLFTSISKPGYSPSLSLPEQVAACAAHPHVLGLGGVTLANVQQVHAMGASGVGCIGAVWHTAQPVQSANSLTNTLIGLSSHRLSDNRLS